MCHSLNLDNIPLGKLFFLRLENVFLLANTGDTIEILSRLDNLESELISWCRLTVAYTHLPLPTNSLV